MSLTRSGSPWGIPAKKPNNVSQNTGTKPKKKQKNQKTAYDRAVSKITSIVGTDLWYVADLSNLDETAELDDQRPETLYYLGQVVDIEEVMEVFVEHRENGKRKHWTVLEERDFDVMDKVYDIERDVLNQYPGSNIQFRVTIQTEDGPSIAPKSYKIYDAS